MASLRGYGADSNQSGAGSQADQQQTKKDAPILAHQQTILEQEEAILRRVNAVQEGKSEVVTLQELKANKASFKIGGDNRVAEDRVKFANMVSGESLVRTDQLYVYYCAVCGQHIVTTDVRIEHTKQRKTDSAYALPLDKDKMYVKHLLKEVYPVETIKLQGEKAGNYEIQYRWKCKDCGVTVAYQAFPHAQDAQKEEKALANTIGAKKTYYLYVLHDAFVTHPTFSRLIKDVNKFKAQNGLM